MDAALQVGQRKQLNEESVCQGMGRTKGTKERVLCPELC